MKFVDYEIFMSHRMNRNDRNTYAASSRLATGRKVSSMSEIMLELLSYVL